MNRYTFGTALTQNTGTVGISGLWQQSIAWMKHKYSFTGTVQYPPPLESKPSFAPSALHMQEMQWRQWPCITTVMNRNTEMGGALWRSSKDFLKPKTWTSTRVSASRTRTCSESQTQTCCVTRTVYHFQTNRWRHYCLGKKLTGTSKYHSCTLTKSYCLFSVSVSTAATSQAEMDSCQNSEWESQPVDAQLHLQNPFSPYTSTSWRSSY